MILFKEDFSKKNAICHYQTSNLSAVKFATLLKRMGVENNKFVLALYQPQLINVDPFSKDLSAEMKLRIAVECKINIWYMLREVARVPSQGSGTSPYIFNRANVGLTWLFCNSITPFLTMPRQIGKTIAAISVFVWVCYLAGQDLSAALFAKDNILVLENVERLKLIRDALPQFLIKNSVVDTNNKEGVSYNFLKTKYKTFVAQTSKLRASSQGRGPSIGLEHWDEFGHYINNDLSYPSATSAITAAADQIRATGFPCTNMITTTAGRLSDPCGLYAYGIKNNCMRFTEKLYDSKNVEELKTVVDSNSNNQMCYLEYSHLQLGKDAAWLKKVTVDKDPATIACDFLNKWEHTSGLSAISKDMSKKLEDNIKEPVFVEVKNGIVIRWFTHPSKFKKYEEKNIPFVIGSDTSDNVGIDFTTMVMTDPRDMSVVCTWKCNLTNFAYVVKNILSMLLEFPKSIFIPERNKNGKVLLDFLILALLEKELNPLKRIYNAYYQEYTQDKELITEIPSVDGDIIKKFGFWTGAASRDILFETVMPQALDTNYDKIFDPDLISEILGLIIKNNRIDHMVGSNDDLTIAYLLSCFFILHGKNINLYGVDRNIFLKNITHDGAKVDPKYKEQQLKIFDRLQRIKKKEEECFSPTLKMGYQNEIKSLESLLDKDIIEPKIISMDQAKKKTENVEFNLFDGSERSLQVFANLRF